jgi:hypothetical protein
MKLLNITVGYAMLLALALPVKASTIKNTNIKIDDVSAEAHVALGSCYKALDIIEKEKSYGDNYSNIVKQIRTSKSFDDKKEHPFLVLDKSLTDIYKKIQDSTTDLPKENIVSMVKQALDDGYKIFNADIREGKIKLVEE